MEDMKKFLPEADLSKLRTILDIKNSYNCGTLSLEDARKLLKEKVVVLKLYEITFAEQELKGGEENECRKEDIQRMLELFNGIMDTSRPDLPPEYSVMYYYRGNDELRKILPSIEGLVPPPYPTNPEQNQYPVYLVEGLIGGISSFERQDGGDQPHVQTAQVPFGAGYTTQSHHQHDNR